MTKSTAECSLLQINVCVAEKLETHYNNFKQVVLYSTL